MSNKEDEDAILEEQTPCGPVTRNLRKSMSGKTDARTTRSSLTLLKKSENEDITSKEQSVCLSKNLKSTFGRSDVRSRRSSSLTPQKKPRYDITSPGPMTRSRKQSFMNNDSPSKSEPSTPNTTNKPTTKRNLVFSESPVKREKITPRKLNRRNNEVANDDKIKSNPSRKKKISLCTNVEVTAATSSLEEIIEEDEEESTADTFLSNDKVKLKLECNDALKSGAKCEVETKESSKTENMKLSISECSVIVNCIPNEEDTKINYKDDDSIMSAEDFLSNYTEIPNGNACENVNKEINSIIISSDDKQNLCYTNNLHLLNSGKINDNDEKCSKIISEVDKTKIAILETIEKTSPIDKMLESPISEIVNDHTNHYSEPDSLKEKGSAIFSSELGMNKPVILSNDDINKEDGLDYSGSKKDNEGQHIIDSNEASCIVTDLGDNTCAPQNNVNGSLRNEEKGCDIKLVNFCTIDLNVFNHKDSEESNYNDDEDDGAKINNLYKLTYPSDKSCGDAEYKEMDDNYIYGREENIAAKCNNDSLNANAHNSDEKLSTKDKSFSPPKGKDVAKHCSDSLRQSEGETFNDGKAETTVKDSENSCNVNIYAKEILKKPLENNSSVGNETEVTHSALFNNNEQLLPSVSTSCAEEEKHRWLETKIESIVSTKDKANEFKDNYKTSEVINKEDGLDYPTTNKAIEGQHIVDSNEENNFVKKDNICIPLNNINGGLSNEDKDYSIKLSNFCTTDLNMFNHKHSEESCCNDDATINNSFKLTHPSDKSCSDSKCNKMDNCIYEGEENIAAKIQCNSDSLNTDLHVSDEKLSTKDISFSPPKGKDMAKHCSDSLRQGERETFNDGKAETTVKDSENSCNVNIYANEILKKPLENNSRVGNETEVTHSALFNNNEQSLPSVSTSCAEEEKHRWLETKIESIVSTKDKANEFQDNYKTSEVINKEDGLDYPTTNKAIEGQHIVDSNEENNFVKKDNICIPLNNINGGLSNEDKDYSIKLSNFCTTDLNMFNHKHSEESCCNDDATINNSFKLTHPSDKSCSDSKCNKMDNCIYEGEENIAAKIQCNSDSLNADVHVSDEKLSTKDLRVWPLEGKDMTKHCPHSLKHSEGETFNVGRTESTVKDSESNSNVNISSNLILNKPLVKNAEVANDTEAIHSDLFKNNEKSLTISILCAETNRKQMPRLLENKFESESFGKIKDGANEFQDNCINSEIHHKRKDLLLITIPSNEKLQEGSGKKLVVSDLHENENDGEFINLQTNMADDIESSSTNHRIQDCANSEIPVRGDNKYSETKKYIWNKCSETSKVDENNKSLPDESPILDKSGADNNHKTIENIPRNDNKSKPEGNIETLNNTQECISNAITENEQDSLLSKDENLSDHLLHKTSLGCEENRKLEFECVAVSSDVFSVLKVNQSSLDSLRVDSEDNFNQYRSDTVTGCKGDSFNNNSDFKEVDLGDTPDNQLSILPSFGSSNFGKRKSGIELVLDKTYENEFDIMLKKENVLNDGKSNNIIEAEELNSISEELKTPENVLNSFIVTSKVDSNNSATYSEVDETYKADSKIINFVDLSKEECTTISTSPKQFNCFEQNFINEAVLTKDLNVISEVSIIKPSSSLAEKDLPKNVKIPASNNTFSPTNLNAVNSLKNATDVECEDLLFSMPKLSSQEKSVVLQPEVINANLDSEKNVEAASCGWKDSDYGCGKNKLSSTSASSSESLCEESTLNFTVIDNSQTVNAIINYPYPKQIYLNNLSSDNKNIEDFNKPTNIITLSDTICSSDSNGTTEDIKESLLNCSDNQEADVIDKISIRSYDTTIANNKSQKLSGNGMESQKKDYQQINITESKPMNEFCITSEETKVGISKSKKIKYEKKNQSMRNCKIVQGSSNSVITESNKEVDVQNKIHSGLECSGKNQGNGVKQQPLVHGQIQNLQNKENIYKGGSTVSKKATRENSFIPKLLKPTMIAKQDFNKSCHNKIMAEDDKEIFHREPKIGLYAVNCHTSHLHNCGSSNKNCKFVKTQRSIKPLSSTHGCKKPCQVTKSTQIIEEKIIKGSKYIITTVPQQEDTFKHINLIKKDVYSLPKVPKIEKDMAIKYSKLDTFDKSGKKVAGTMGEVQNHKIKKISHVTGTTITHPQEKGNIEGASKKLKLIYEDRQNNMVSCSEQKANLIFEQCHSKKKSKSYETLPIHSIPSAVEKQIEVVPKLIKKNKKTVKTHKIQPNAALAEKRNEGLQNLKETNKLADKTSHLKRLHSNDQLNTDGPACKKIPNIYYNFAASDKKVDLKKKSVKKNSIHKAILCNIPRSTTTGEIEAAFCSLGIKDVEEIFLYEYTKAQYHGLVTFSSASSLKKTLDTYGKLSVKGVPIYPLVKTD